MERVVVTGIGVASPIGFGVSAFWQGLVCGKSGVAALDGEEFADLPAPIGARVQDSDLDGFVSRKELRRLSRASHLALAATAEAVEQAGITRLSPTARSEVAILIGSSIGGFAASDPIFKEYYRHGKQNSLVIPMSMNSGPSANVSIRYGFGGPQMTADAACASSAHSIGMLYNLIRFGQVEIGITGGADSPFAQAVLQAWINLRVLSSRRDSPQTACRPFSADRDGMVLGEGAGILVLESESSARRRGARALAELVGYGASSDSHHITQPSKDGPALAMVRALRDAGLTSDSIDTINAHGTATIWNDRNETAAIKHVFGEKAYRIPVVGTKAATGHSIGASGALELIACIKTLEKGVVPPTLNYQIQDPDCDLDYVVEGARGLSAQTAMSNSFAFGGSNASLILRKAG